MGTKPYHFFFNVTGTIVQKIICLAYDCFFQIFLRIKKVGKRTIGHDNSGGSCVNFSILNLNAWIGQCGKKREFEIKN